MENSQSAINQLEQRLTRLEQESRELRAALDTLRAGDTATGAPGTAPRPSATPAPAARPGRSAVELELFSGNLLGRLGMVALILTAGWFIKYAFDNYWINESGRIFTGLFSGYLVMGGGLFLARRKYRVLPGPVIGTGFALLYIAVFGAYYFYDLLGLNETFALLFILSAAAAVLALTADSQMLYVFSLTGAYLAPFMLSRGENSYRFLFLYLLVVHLGFFYISTRRAWRFAPFLVALAGLAVFGGWFYASAAASSFPVPFFFVLATFALGLYREVVLMPGLRRAVPLDSVALVYLESIGFFISAWFLVDLFYPAGRPHLLVATSAILLLAYVLHERLAFGVLAGRGADERFFMRTALLTLALPLLIAAPYHAFENGEWVTLMLAFAGVFSLIGTYRRFDPPLVVSLPLWMFGVLWLLIDPPAAKGWPFLNLRFSMYLIAAALMAATYFFRRDRTRGELSAFLYIAFALVIAGTLNETHDLIDSRHYRNLAYSLTLFLYAAGFLAAGFRLRKKQIRYAGMALAGIVVLKFYLFDIWTLSRLVRIIAGFCLGGGLVLVSIFYQKYRQLLLPGTGGDEPPATGPGAKAALALLLGLALAWPTGSAMAENASGFRPASFRYYRELTLPPARDPAPVYGRLELDETVVRLGSEADLRIAFAGRPIPYIRRAIPLDDRTSGTVRPEVIFDRVGKESRAYVLKLPAPPAETEFYEFEVATADGSDFETSVDVRFGNTAECPESAGSFTLYSYENKQPGRLKIRVGRAGFLRLEFDTRQAYQFLAARYRAARAVDEFAVPVTLEEFAKRFDEDTNSTVYAYANPGGRRIHRVELYFQEKRFRRTVEVQRLDRESKNYVYVLTGTLAANEPAENARQTIAFPEPIATAFKISIQDEDNPSLVLEKVELFAPREELVFELPPANAETRDLALFYGNPYAYVPAYELSRTYDPKLPHAAIAAGDHRNNADFAYSMLEPPVSTWIIRALFTLGLLGVGFPALRILKKYAAETGPDESGGYNGR